MFAGGADAADESRYTLFDPTPRGLMREMNTDRPDKTESPYTIDAGHLQLEMDVASYTHDRERDAGVTTRVDAWAVAPIDLKLGLCKQVDLQLVVETWNDPETKTSGAGPRRAASTRLRRRDDAPEVQPLGRRRRQDRVRRDAVLKLPTNEDGLGNPRRGRRDPPVGRRAAARLRHGPDDGVRLPSRPGERRHHPEFVDSITVDHEIVGDLDGYVEFFSAVSTEQDSDWIGTVDLGMIYHLTETSNSMSA